MRENMQSTEEKHYLFEDLKYINEMVNKFGKSINTDIAHTLFLDLDNGSYRDRIYIKSIQEENIEYGQKISLVLNKVDSEFMTISLTKYDEFKFKENVKQPFMWDGDAAAIFADREFSYFLADKGLIDEFEIIAIKDNKVIKSDSVDDDRYELDDLLSQINFQELINLTSSNLLTHQKINKCKM